MKNIAFSLIAFSIAYGIALSTDISLVKNAFKTFF